MKPKKPNKKQVIEDLEKILDLGMILWLILKMKSGRYKER